jgi:hypothetical protein
MTRRDFFRFMVFGGLIGYLARRLRPRQRPRKAMFWKRVG